MTLYASTEAHATNVEAADLLGIGESAVRAVATDERLRMRVDALEAAIAADMADGAVPFAVVASAGTTGTGAIDPLTEIAEVAERHGMWLHVDAAYGGAAAFAPDLAPLLAGIERADSISFDPHKWLYTPQSSACLLVRDLAVLERSFGVEAAYVREDAALSGMGTNIGALGPQWSRSFMALKVWMSLAAHGLDAYGRRISHDVELARYLHAEAARRPDFEPAGEVCLAIACFRYVPPGLPEGARARALPERAQRTADDGAEDGRPSVSDERGAERDVRAARVHRQLPHRGRRHRPDAGRGIRAGRRAGRPAAPGMIRPLAADDAQACDAIIAGLPEWFGLDEGIAECAAAVRIQRGLVAEADGAVVGFVTHRLHYPQAGELTWLAVARGAQRQGHGRELVEALAGELAGAGVRHLTVRTLSDRSDDEYYARTRAFYRATGFVPLLDLPELWDAENPAMVFVRDLDSGS